MLELGVLLVTAAIAASFALDTVTGAITVMTSVARGHPRVRSLRPVDWAAHANKPLRDAPRELKHADSYNSSVRDGSSVAAESITS